MPEASVAQPRADAQLRLIADSQRRACPESAFLFPRRAGDTPGEPFALSVISPRNWETHMEQVTLVDENDCAIGAEEKIQAHRDGKLHRAFSIFVFNSEQELLLQRRAWSKYHSGGLWSNTCCGHPRPGEAPAAAARRRLVEELGFACDLRESFTFPYRAELDHGLIENELDHVFVGCFDGEPRPDPSEVAEFQWLSLGRLREALESEPESFTYWLKVALSRNEWNLSAPGCNAELVGFTTEGMGSGC